MKKYIYILLILSNLFAANNIALNSKISDYHDAIFPLLRNGKTRELLKNIRNYLKSDDLVNNGKEEIYLKMWEIKALFYEGKIDSSLIKYEDFKLNINNGSYNKLKKLPFYSYILNESKSKDCMVNNLSEDVLKIWNLEILNSKQFSKHFSDFDLLIGKNIKDYTIIPDEHEQKILIKDISGKKVMYSIFPPLIQSDEYRLEEYDIDVVLEHEFNLAKQNRLKFLQQQVKKPIRFINYNDKIKKYTCKLDFLPIINSRSKSGVVDQVHDFYKLYIHDYVKTERYTFQLNKKTSSSNDNLILINWDKENWIMHEDFDENKIEISIPDYYQKSVKVSIEGRNLKTLDEIEDYSDEERIKVRRKGHQNISDFDKWEIDQSNFNFQDMNVYQTEMSDSMLVDRLEIIADTTFTTLNIQVSNNYETYNKDKKQINFFTRVFYSSLFIAIVALFSF